MSVSRDVEIQNRMKAMAERHSPIEYMSGLPLARFIMRENGEFVEKTTRDLFFDKRVVLFGLPGAFTPTCTTSQVPDFEAAYDDLIAAGVDEVYCISVNDAFVMNAWRESLGVEKVKFIPDGNGFFTRQLGKSVFKSNLGFGVRSWRYAAVVDSDVIEVMFSEEGQVDNCKEDPYEMSKPEKVLNYLKEVSRREDLKTEEDEDAIGVLEKFERELFLKRHA
jgi:peroxiredoxin